MPQEKFCNIIVHKGDNKEHKMQETLNTKAFGKNDIRGIFPSEVNSQLYFYVGKGYVNWAKEQFSKINGQRKPTDEMLFCVCMDARLHSKELKDSLIQGILSTGANVLDLGLAPTPLGYFSEFAKIDNETLEGKKVNGALIVTASHNPSEYNGLKMTFNRASLSEEQIKEVKDYTLKAFENAKESNYRTIRCGFDKEYDIISNYCDKISDMFDKVGAGIKVVVDSANATGGLVAPQLYRELGCEVIELFSEPDGNFPNHHPNPSDEKTLDSIKKAVVENKADFGIAFDGDSDRIGVISSDGKAISGDKLLLIYSLDLINELKAHGETPTIVSEVKCSQVLYDTINNSGGNAIMYKTGHGYIKSKMKETGALLAGEMSGHVFFKDRYFGYDDAIYAGCRLIEIVAKNKKRSQNFDLKDLILPFNKVYLSNEVRLKCPNEYKKDVLEELKGKISDDFFNSKIKEIVTIDGLRIIFEDGFALIRQSNTEPVFTLRFEANTKERCKDYQEKLCSLTEELVKKHAQTKV